MALLSPKPESLQHAKTSWDLVLLTLQPPLYFSASWFPFLCDFLQFTKITTASSHQCWAWEIPGGSRNRSALVVLLATWFRQPCGGADETFYGLQGHGGSSHKVCGEGWNEKGNPRTWKQWDQHGLREVGQVCAFHTTISDDSPSLKHVGEHFQTFTNG